MKTVYLLLVFFVSAPAIAADRAIVLNDNEAAALVQLIDEALKSKGAALAQNAAYWLTKIQNAPTVTEQKPVEPPKESPQ